MLTAAPSLASSSHFLPRFTSSFFFTRKLHLHRVHCFSKMSTTPTTGPLIPKFVPVEISDIASASRPDGNRLSLVSYNILAQAYVKSAFFPHSPGPCLNTDGKLVHRLYWLFSRVWGPIFFACRK
ncbi:OLC1v1030736C1 [Oldenlandia corymbosa var. corymbosa]|uniref:OLC1v1030736C1 n=1 Tax=Oldenlandia corymbosa var. corymbosa TaxID=529605 RepID=A0AAV1CHI7_OLDCO|nr:OLC1v1030736C1 [Oldenlandia corymbosa var. corymbosa]